MVPRRTTGKGKAHQFGGDWTNAKLDVLKKYLSAYTTALKNQPFVKRYVDAFAGTGYRTARKEKVDASPQELLLFPDLAEKEPQGLLDGSARIALKTEPRFEKYIFIERSAERCAELEALKAEFPRLASDITIRQGDANTEIRDLCSKGGDWRGNRAVLFLDPYGMQVEWATIVAIAETKAIDMWLLFPLGIGVNRLVTKSGDIPESWQQRLDLLLGTTAWREEFHKIQKRLTLFGPAEQVEKATTESIGRYFNERLKTVFAAVAEQPRVLRNSANSPLYLLCFAAANERGAPVALKIANHLLKEGVQ